MLIDDFLKYKFLKEQEIQDVFIKMNYVYERVIMVKREVLFQQFTNFDKKNRNTVTSAMYTEIASNAVSENRQLAKELYKIKYLKL